MEANKVEPVQAKDTLMSKDEMLGCSLVGKYPFKDVEDVINETCIHQAEITWDIASKAGQEEENKGWVKAFMDVGILIAEANTVGIAIDETKRAGIREVVEWINKNCMECQSNTPSNKDEYLGFHKQSWQTQCKKWGIK